MSHCIPAEPVKKLRESDIRSVQQEKMSEFMLEKQVQRFSQANYPNIDLPFFSVKQVQSADVQKE